MTTMARFEENVMSSRKNDDNSDYVIRRNVIRTNVVFCANYPLISKPHAKRDRNFMISES